MLRFTVKLLLLISTLLFGLLLGIHQAEHGIFSIEGLTFDRQESVYIKKVDLDHVEMAIVGETFSTMDLEEKQEKWKERQNQNKLSQLGNKIGETVYSLSRKGAEWFISKIEKLL